MADETHGHSHGPPIHKNRPKGLKISIVLLGIYAILEFIAGYFSNSIPVTGDSFHQLVDLVALILAYWVNSRSVEKEENKGLEKKVTIFNLVVLSSVALWIVYEIILRVVAGSAEVIGWPIFLVACAGLIINLAIYKILYAHPEETIKSALVCVLPDAASAGLIMLNGILVIIFGRTFYWADSAVALIITVMLLYTVLKIVRSLAHKNQLPL